MRSRRAFVLPAVLAALVVMAMLVAVAAQRALVATRDAALSEARVELAAAAQVAMADALAQAVDTVRLRAAAPGVPLDSGLSRIGSAEASWRVTVVLAPIVLLSIEASSPAREFTARSSWRLWLRRRETPSGEPVWASVGSGWRARFPSP